MVGTAAFQYALCRLRESRRRAWDLAILVLLRLRNNLAVCTVLGIAAVQSAWLVKEFMVGLMLFDRNCFSQIFGGLQQRRIRAVFRPVWHGVVRRLTRLQRITKESRKA